MGSRNELESINGKLKQVINRHSTLEAFVDRFFIILTALRTERDHKAALVFQRVKVNPFRDDSSENMYSQLLTNYSANFQLELADKLANKLSQITEEGDTYVVKTSEGQKNVTISSCECIFRKSMLLPCRHIFALRSQLGLSTYGAALCNERWTTAYYRSTHRIFSARSSEGTMVLTTGNEHRRSLSQHQKFRKMSILSVELASVASYASKNQFDRRMKVMKELILYWKNREEVGLAELNESAHKIFNACSGEVGEVSSESDDEQHSLKTGTPTDSPSQG